MRIARIIPLDTARRRHSRWAVILLVRTSQTCPIASPSIDADGHGSVLYPSLDPSGFASPSTVNAPRDWQPQTPNGPGRNPYGGPPPQPSPLQQSPHEVPVSGSASPAPGGPPGSQPSLMRTSQLSSGPVPVSAYVVSNAKASLVLQQDLNLMAVGW